MAAEITVSYERRPGYPQEDMSYKEATIIDKLICAYADRITLAKQLLGFRIGSIIYSPHEYDAGDEPLANLFAKDVHIDPIIGLDGEGSYTKAELTIRYQHFTYSLTPPEGETVYVSESLEPASEFLTLSHEGLYWDNAQAEPLDSTAAPAKIIRMMDWVYTIHQISSIPSWVWTHPGAVNAASTKSKELNKTFAAQTLLCGNPSLSREITSEGTTAWTITVRLTYRIDGWNKFPHTEENGALSMDTIYDGAGAAKTFYATANFGNIIL